MLYKLDLIILMSKVFLLYYIIYIQIDRVVYNFRILKLTILLEYLTLYTNKDFVWFYICIGTDYPALKYLYKYIKTDIANDWYEIGVELFDVGDEAVLNTVKKSYPGDPNRCAAEMLRLWLARKPEASWNQLLETLREPHIKLKPLLQKLKECCLKVRICM